MNEQDYQQQLQALLPQGAAWTREPKANLTKLLSALACEYASVDKRGGELVDEALVTYTLEMLSDWERVTGLFPDDNLMVAQRRQQLINKLNQRGGQSKAFFIALAESLGFYMSITEFRPFRVEIAHIGEPLTNGEWVFCWEVFMHPLEGNEQTPGTTYETLIRLIEKYKPAHTKIKFLF